MVGRIFLGRYQATRLLGEGGMGKVYLARQLDLGRQVVVKVMNEQVASDANFCQRFQRETLLMARFQHPYAVTLYDASLNDPEGPCIIMEYIRGETLDNLLAQNGHFTPGRVGRLLSQICEVLQAAHAQGIIHRDLKPANLMIIDPDTPYEKIKVMDFGLAKLLDPQAIKKAVDSNSDFAVGTPSYMCPEQVRGEEMDHRGDIYSVGIIVYELLSGKLPFEGRSPMDMMLAHATEDPPSLAAVGAGDWVPPAVEAVIMSCLAKDPAKRPPTARDLADRYETAMDHEQVKVEQALPPEDPRSDSHPGLPQLPAREIDPHAVVHELDAWMPEMMMAYKLCGFFQDVGGQVIENAPGRIRVRLGGPGSVYTPPPGQGALSWLGLRRSGLIEMDLYLDKLESKHDNRMHVTVALRRARGGSAEDAEWQACCNQIFCDLRGYLMGHTGDGTEIGG